jgi:hypothetical protein
VAVAALVPAAAGFVVPEANARVRELAENRPGLSSGHARPPEGGTKLRQRQIALTTAALD